MKTCYQINLMQGYGGGEVYTRFFTRAVRKAGWRQVVFAHPKGPLFRRLQEDGVELVAVENFAAIAAHLPSSPCLIVSHTPALDGLVPVLASHYWASFAHMPQTGRNPAAYRPTDRVMGVSAYVNDTLCRAGIQQVWTEPMYGIADLVPRGTSKVQGIIRHSCYDWDKRKVRDRLMGWAEPMVELATRSLRKREVYRKRAGLTLGIVSRLTPIKQFPLMFEHLVPVLQQYDQVNLEIFGSGGYRSVADLRQVLAPLGGRVRFWGQQSNVAEIYQQIDYLLSGLPEKEALGLNLIEAQACGTGVLAVNAPPFTETVKQGVTGWLYTDPRTDGGKSFEQCLQRLLRGEQLDRREAAGHLAQFSEQAFEKRVARLLQGLDLGMADKFNG